MENRLIKDALAALPRKLRRLVVWRRKERRQDLLHPSARATSRFSPPVYQNAPKYVFFPHTRHDEITRTPKGWSFRRRSIKPTSRFIGVRPCDAHSFVLLDKLFDQEKYKDGYYIEQRKNTTVI
jgi:hypothetical protein